MLKRIIFLFFCWLFCFTTAIAAPNVNTGYSYVLITNNTNEPINVQPALTTQDSEFQRGKDWDGTTLTLAPYETKQVLWFNRNQDVKANQLYQFDISARNSNYPSDDMTVTFVEKGKKVYGSEISTDLTLPGQAKQTILKNRRLEKFSDHFWGGNHTVYARNWLPDGKLFSDYHLVIDEAENDTFNTNSNLKLSILTYNTQLLPFYANGIDDLNQPNIRAKDISHKITEFDVVILEELFDRDLRNKMINAMRSDYPYYTHVVGDGTSKALTGGVMIFSKWPIIKKDQIVYEHSAGIDSFSAKGAIYAAINKQGKIYHVIGTHTQSGNFTDDINARREQLIELSLFTYRLAIPLDQPLLLGGDFNVDQFSKEADTLLAWLHVSMLDNIGYRYSIDPITNTMNVGKDRSRIDYIFYSNQYAKPQLAFNKVFILRDLDNEQMWPKFDLSDHFSVAGYFEFDG